MKVIVTKNYDEMSAAACEIVAETVKNRPDCVLGLATGSTPEGMYAKLIEKYNAGELDFSNARSVNLDEYYPISPDNDQSYRYFMNTKFFDHVNIRKEETHVPDGSAKDVDAFCADYEALIDSLGGADIQVLGIGRNGHIGFNEPEEALRSETHLTALTEDTIKANARFFASEDEVPAHAITMGIGSVFKAKKILLLASGSSKAEAIAKMLEGRITTNCPATLLYLHPDVTVICDEAAYALVK